MNRIIPMWNETAAGPSEGATDWDLNLLRVFDAVLTERSITRAAERLGLAQPTVSNALARLRRLTGDALFVRTREGMAPTPHAESMAVPLRQAMATLQTTLRRPPAFDPATSDRRFTLYISDLGEAFFLPRLLARLRQEAPGVRLSTLPMPEHDPQAALESGEVDLAIGNLPDFSGAGWYQQRLLREHYIVIARNDHPLLTPDGALSRAAFGAAAHAVVLPAGTGHGVVEATLRAEGLGERIALRVQNFLSLPAIVACTDLLAIVPRSVAAQWSAPGAADAPLRQAEPPIALPDFDVRQCWHERWQGDAGHRWLRERLAGIAA
jgi:DNA-binding transcriptional LysR family regulator